MKVIKNKKRGSKFKLPRFMVCENPISESGEYILHCREPKMLIKVFNLTNTSIEERKDWVKQIPVYGACEIGSVLYYLVPVEQYTNFFGENKEEVNQNLSSLMKRCADWWKSYVIWEENNLN